jgi:UDP-2,4-diacetamido-2,4,6-trideoxy-beta-L-altropyranose hydrolase
MSKIKTILFRADSSSKIGLGHIMRDLVLAAEYAKKGHKIIFATQNLKGNINHKIIKSGYQLKTLKSNSKKELVKLIQKLKVDLLVFDHYKITYKKEKYIKEKRDLKILAFDDTYEKHHCDILLNHNISADKKRYKNLVPKDCKVYCGSKYTLLRDEFIQEKKKKTVFIAMGGADHSNINIKILDVLQKFEDIKVHLVTTSANSNLQELQAYVKKKKWIKLHLNSTQLAKLMKKSDFAIITPSVTLNEVVYMELPFIAIQTAKNQKDIYKYLVQQKKLTLKQFHKKQLYFTIKQLLGTQK